jgi:hypothetical protein
MRLNQPNHSLHWLILTIATLALLACGLDSASVRELSSLWFGAPTATPTPVRYALNLASAQAGLAELSSYRASLQVEFDGSRNGQPAAGRIESVTGLAQSPPTIHRFLKTEVITPTAQLANGVSEYFETESRRYLKKAGEDTWLVLTRGQEVAGSLAVTDLGWPELEQLIVIPPTVITPPQLETLDGLGAVHYRFNENDLPDANIIFEQAQGEAWLATHGQLLLRYTLSATITIPTPLPNAHLLDRGRLRLEYALTGVNGELTVTPPELETILAQNQLDRLPRLPEAQISSIFPTMLEYTSVISPISATLFYRDQLAAQEWTENSADIFNEKSRLSYTKNEEALTILITPGETSDRVNVVLEVNQ